MATKTIKMAGPDSTNHYKVLQVKGHLEVKPGDVYSEKFVMGTIMRWPSIETTVIEPRFDRGERRMFLNRLQEPVS